MRENLKFYTKLFPVAIVLISTLLTASCSEDRTDMTGLLSTVPSSSSAVMAIDLKSILQDMGCKVNGNEIKPGKEFSENLKTMGENDKTKILEFFNGESGISPESSVIFFDSNRMFFTMALADAGKFCSYVANSNGQPFIDEGNGVKVNGNIAVKGSQTWICLSSGKRIDADAIVGYSSLKSSQSFISSEMAEKFVEPNSDIVGWGHLKVILDSFMSRSNVSIMNLAAGFLFDDASDIFFSVDFKSGEMKATAMLLNEKGKPAKYLLQAEKIDTKAIETLGENCDALLALTLTPKMVKKLEKAGSALGGNLFGDLGELLNNIDGTIAVASSSFETQVTPNFTGLITTKGEVSLQLKDLISPFVGSLREDGKYLRFSQGTLSGPLPVKECVNQLKGSCFGLVADLNGLDFNGLGGQNANFFNSLAFTLSPESGSLELKLVLKAIDKKENILVTILRAIR